MDLIFLSRSLFRSFLSFSFRLSLSVSLFLSLPSPPLPHPYNPYRHTDLTAASTIFRALAVGGTEQTRRLMIQGGCVRLLLIQALNHADGPLSRQATADAQGGRRGAAPIATPLNTMALYEERTAARRQVLALELVVDIWDTFPIIFSLQDGLERSVIDSLSKASRSNAFPLQVCAITSLFHILEQDHVGVEGGEYVGK